MLQLLRHARIIFFVAIVLMATVKVVPVQATTVTGLSDAPTTEDAGTVSNHTLLFTTPTGVSEGDTITITFDASFDTSSLTEDDIDVADDTVDLTTASDCSGSEQASVVVASDVVTMTICAGDGGAIAPSSTVSVEIGTQASSSGTGANGVTNPSTVGTYSIRLAGSFGDVGNVWLPIITTGGLPATAYVPNSGGGGGPTSEIDPDTCGDTTFPEISETSVTSVTESSALINWQTDENTTSQVEYGLDASYGLSEASEALTQFHALALSGLTEGTVYHFRVSSVDGCLNQSFGGDLTFTTTDTTSPVISNVTVTNITTSSATISWTTNEPTTGVVTYGLSTSYGMSVVTSVLSTSHSVILSGLIAGKTYHYAITATDAFSNTSATSDATFTVLTDLPPGNVLNLSAVQSSGAIKLAWELPVESDLAGIRIVWRTDHYPTSTSDGTIVDLGLVTGFTHSGVSVGVTYYYTVFVRDLAGQYSSGALVSWTVQDETTIDDTLPPVDDTVPPTDDTLPPVGDDTTDTTDDTTDTTDSTTVVGGDGVVCGNAVCEAGESTITCPVDCVFEVPDVTSGNTLSSVAYFVAGETIQVYPVNGVVSLLPGRQVTVRFPESSAWIDRTLQLTVGSSSYLFALENGEYTATVTTPSQVGQVQMQIVSLNGDVMETLQSVIWNLNPFGFTFELVDGERERIGFARVTLLADSGGTFILWDSAVYGQLNPQTTPQDGTFAWYVPIGRYVVTADAEGYRQARTAPIFVTNAIVAMPIELLRKPLTIPEAIALQAPPLEKLQVVAGAFLGSLNESIDVLRAIPQIQQGVDVATPAVLTASVISAVVLSTSFDLIPFLQYLITSPVLLFWRRRRNKWGVVYDAVSKQPIDLAIVRLYRLADGRLVQSRVTDKFGRYFFLVDPGEYRLGVTKRGFVFPGKLLANRRQDGAYLDLYHGEPIHVDEHVAITANIPLDPASSGAQQAPKQIRLKRLLRAFQHTIAFAGLLLSFLVAVLRPSPFTFILFGVQILLLILVWRLSHARRKPKGWGIIYDTSSRRPLAGAVVRIFEPIYNKLLATAVTDRRGRYTFLVGPSEYYARVEKLGYDAREIRPIDLKDKTEATDITVDIGMDPSGSPPKSPPTS